MLYVDANIVIRFILDDNKEMADYAQSLFETGKTVILPEVMAEIVYVLTKVYKMGKKQIVLVLRDILKYATSPEPAVMQKALATYAETSLDFVDCLLYAYNKVLGIEVHTFDKKLQSKLKSSDS